MKFKIFLASVFFVCSLLPGSSLAQNKVVVIPMKKEFDKKPLRALCRGYDIKGNKAPARFNCPPKIVFITSARYDGNFLAGIYLADRECQALADSSDLTKGRVFKAWLSDDSTSPLESFVRSQTPYVLVTGTKVADNWEDLVDGSLDNNIALDQNGAEVVQYKVWTGTNLAGVGLPDEYTCDGWFSSASDKAGLYGDALSKTADWTQKWFDSCSNLNHLYCFEQ